MWKALFLRFLAEEQGMQHVEEALLLSLFGVAFISISSDLGDTIASAFQNSADAMNAALP